MNKDFKICSPAQISAWDKKVLPDQLEALLFLCNQWAVIRGSDNSADFASLYDLANGHDSSDNLARNRANGLSAILRRVTYKTTPQTFARLHAVVTTEPPIKMNDTDEEIATLELKNKRRRWNNAVRISQKIFDLFELKKDIDSETFKSNQSRKYYQTNNKVDTARVFFEKEFGVKKVDFNKDFKRFLPTANENKDYVIYSCFREATSEHHKIVRTRIILERPATDRPFTRFWNFAVAEHDEPRNARGVAIPLKGQTHLLGRLEFPVDDDLGSKAVILGSVKKRMTCNGLLLSRTLNKPITIMSRVFCVREEAQKIDFDKDGNPLNDNSHIGVFDTSFEASKEGKKNPESIDWVKGLLPFLPDTVAMENSYERDKLLAENILLNIRNYPENDVINQLNRSGISKDEQDNILNLLRKSITLIGER